MVDMSARQWNLMIAMVNDDSSRKEVEKHFSKEEMEIYDRMYAEFAELRKSNPNAAFSPVESDW